MQMKLYPAILSDSMPTVIEQLESVKASEHIERVHVDIIDGQFIDNVTITPMDLTVAEFDQLKLDLHLMTEEPMDVVFECEAIREYLPIQRIIGQVERMSHQEDFIHEVQRNGWQVGLGLDIYTPLEAVDESSWQDIDTLLLMGIEAGHQEQIFNVQVLQKIKELHEMKLNKKIDVIVDGGVKLSNIVRILQSGVQEVAVGSALWKSNEPVKMIEEFFTASHKVKHATE
jgi:ribulose-phosphate 3-epimerase